MRKAPLLEAMSQIHEVGSDLLVCTCGGELEYEAFEMVSVTEIPACPKVEVEGCRVEIKRCKCCKKRYLGRRYCPKGFPMFKKRTGRECSCMFH